MEKTASIHLPFSSIENCRDLGGMETTDGRIVRNSLLFRSANLHKASEQDLLTFDNMGLRHILDLRTDWEIALQPDQMLKHWDVQHLPIIHESTISKKEGGQIEAAEELVENTSRDLTEIYPLLVLSDQAIAMWKKFFKALIHRPGAYLFHCTQGKDRTGTAAILIEHALQVKEELIETDYLQTNLYVLDPVLKDMAWARELLKGKSKHLKSDAMGYLSARPEYYQALNEAIASHYGTWDNYLKEALKLSDQDLEVLRAYYLEYPA